MGYGVKSQNGYNGIPRDGMNISDEWMEIDHLRCLEMKWWNTNTMETSFSQIRRLIGMKESRWRKGKKRHE